MISREPLAETGFVSRMQDALIHRGPDGAGSFKMKRQVVLAVRRLSIIDLISGWQPLYNEDKSLTLICNGEIYNFVELRESLEARGHTFRTHSDSETILHLYEDFGIDCVHHLRGMFAFALWDSKQHMLFLARDRIGEKPLYLYEQDGLLLFASEMKSLLASGLVPFDLDPKSIDLYFHYHYVPEPMTAIRNVRKLRPGFRMTIRLHPWEIQEDCYWRMEDAPPITDNPGECLFSELESVAKIVVRSDVPIGIALSGGLDSSAIAALISKNRPDQLQAFTVGYPGRPVHDERNDARALAEFLRIPFHETELRTEEMAANFPDLVRSRDDPIADISAYGYYSVMKLAREHGVTVMMQGQGGDELFWGYPWVADAVRRSIRKGKLLHNGIQALPEYFRLTKPASWSRRDLRKWMRNWLGFRDGWNELQMHKTSPPDQLVFYDLVADFQNARSRTRRDLYSNTFSEELNDSDPCALFKNTPPWSATDILLTRLICETYLLQNGIAQADRLSMASSVELRLPLVDFRLIETVIGLRKKQSDYLLPPKSWLKEATRKILPDWVLNRPKKAFSPPAKEWFAALFEKYGKCAKCGYLEEIGVLKPEITSNLAEGATAPRELGALMFRALVLEIWCQEMQR